MLGQKLRRLGILAAPAALTLMATSAVQAQYNTYYPFDTSASVETVAGGDYGISPTATPPYLNSRFDYGSGLSSHTTGWTNAADHTADGGGSLMMGAVFKGGGIAADSMAFTEDLWWSTQLVTNISFYLQIAPGSAVSGDNGASYAAGSSGYFQVAYRDGSYGFDNVPDVIVNGVDQHANGYNFGDPTYSGSSDQGTWEHIVIPFSTPTALRALTFQDYNNDSSGGVLVAGNVTWYIDDLTFTPPVVPEPASLGLLGLAVPALLARRRKHA